MRWNDYGWHYGIRTSLIHVGMSRWRTDENPGYSGAVQESQRLSVIIIERKAQGALNLAALSLARSDVNKSKPRRVPRAPRQIAQPRNYFCRVCPLRASVYLIQWAISSTSNG